MAKKWVGFKTTDGKYHLCPDVEVFNLVKAGEALQVITVGLEPYALASWMHNQGMTPDMRQTHKHVTGKSKAGRPSRPVVCNETGTVYNSINEAAKACGCANSNLSNHLRHPFIYKTVKGYTFKFYKDKV